MSAVWEKSKAQGSALLLELAIADHAHDDGTGAWPSIKFLSKKTRQSIRNTQYLVRTLEELGELEVSVNAGPAGTNCYTVNPGGAKIAGGCKPAQNLTRDCTRGVQTSVKNIRQIAPEPLEPSINHQGNGSSPVLKPFERISAEKELDRIGTEMKSIQSNYDSHQSWEPSHRERFKVLKARKADLKNVLGLVA